MVINPIAKRTAIVGVGESEYFRRGGSADSEFRLCLTAIKNAVDDAGLEIKDIDGFCGFSNDRNVPSHIASVLGIRSLRFSNMVWGGGGGGGSAAVANAAAAVHAGYAETVVVFRSLAQGEFGRFGRASFASPDGQRTTVSGAKAFENPYGLISPAQRYAMKVRRFMEMHGVDQEALKAIALASYHHAQRNPRAVRYGRPLDSQTYDESRWIVEPFKLFDCCMENDGAAAVIVTSAERARDLRNTPAYILAAEQGSGYREGERIHNQPDYASANFSDLARRMYEKTGLTASDIDVVQAYENFTGGVLLALIEHGFCEADQVQEVFRLENLTFDSGRIPLNTSGGNIAECYVHGLELVNEAVRQIRGVSTAQVAGAELSMVISGPMVAPVSNLLLAS